MTKPALLKNHLERAGFLLENTTVISDELQRALDAEGLTIYGASQIIGAETDETLNAIHKRISRLLKRPPKSVADLEQDLAALGYRLKIERVK